MNFRFTNRILRRNGSRVLWGHLIWFLFFLLIGVPVSYLWGFQSQSDAFDRETLRPYWEESARATPAVVIPPRTIADMIFPFGEREVESGSLNGWRVWTVKYPVVSNEYGSGLIAELEPKWSAKGFEIQNSGSELLARKASGDVVLLARIDGNRTLEIHGWLEQDRSASELTAGLFHALGLPDPPGGATLLDHSSPGTTTSLFYSHPASVRAVTNDYTRAMKSMDWHELPMGEAAESAGRQGIDMRIFRKDKRTVSVSFAPAPSGGTFVSIVAM